MDFFQYAVRDMGDLFVRHLEAIDILHGGSNVALAHTAPIEGEDLALYGGDVALMLLDNLRLERALAVTRHMDGDFAQCGRWFCISPLSAASKMGAKIRLTTSWMSCASWG